MYASKFTLLLNGRCCKFFKFANKNTGIHALILTPIHILNEVVNLQ